jgi:hypothetical protein
MNSVTLIDVISYRVLGLKKIILQKQFSFCLDKLIVL